MRQHGVFMTDTLPSLRDAAPDEPETGAPAGPTTHDGDAGAQPVPSRSDANAEAAKHRLRWKEERAAREAAERRLAEIEAEKAKAEEKRAKEQGKWQEIATAKERELEELRDRVRARDLRDSVERIVRKEAPTADPDAVDLLLDALIPRLKVEWSDSGPRGEWKDPIRKAVKVLGIGKAKDDGDKPSATPVPARHTISPSPGQQAQQPASIRDQFAAALVRHRK